MGEKHTLNKSQTKNRNGPRTGRNETKLSKLRQELEETGKIILGIKTNKVIKE